MAASILASLDLDTSPAMRRIQELARSTPNIKLKVDADSRPLGRITGQLSEFNKSLDAATARVLAFGASVGTFYTVQRGIEAVVRSTIQVEKSLVDINLSLGLSTKSLAQFGGQLFDIAKNTGQSFKNVAQAAGELSRQGLGVGETLKRTSDAMILARRSGLAVEDSIEAITAALNSFNNIALDSTSLINKIIAVDTNFAVSSKDLAEAIRRVGSTAIDAGVGLDQLLGMVTAVQQTTARGGPVIGNGFKTIFSRVQNPEIIKQLQLFGVQINETQTGLEKLQAVAQATKNLSPVDANQIKLITAGTFQINILNSLLDNLAQKNSIVEQATKKSSQATNEAIIANERLNQTLSARVNKLLVTGGQAAEAVGRNTLSPLVNLGVDATQSIFSGIVKADQGGSTGAIAAKSFAQGFAQFITGPGALLIGFSLTKIIGRFTTDAVQALKSLAGLDQQSQVVALLKSQPALVDAIINKKITESQLQQQIVTGLREQLLIQNAISKLAPGVSGAISTSGLNLTGGRLGGKIPGFANPLASAIGRETSFGLSSSQIRVSSHPRLSSAFNPGGIGVFNTRDEPGGLYQGISRSIKEGKDPTKYNIPNFADMPDLSNLGLPFIQQKHLESKIGAILTQAQSTGSSSIGQGTLFANLKRSSEKLGLTAREYELLATEVKRLRNKVADTSRVMESFNQGNGFFTSKQGTMPIGGGGGTVVKQSPPPSFYNRSKEFLQRGSVRNGLTAGLILPSLASSTADMFIDQNSLSGRRTSSLIAGGADIASYAAGGALLGGPWGAAIGAIIGTISAAARVTRTWNESIQDYTKALESNRQSINEIDDSFSFFKQAADTFKDAREGRKSLSSEEQTKILGQARSRLLSVKGLSAADRIAIEDLIPSGKTDDLGAFQTKATSPFARGASIGQILQNLGQGRGENLPAIAGQVLQLSGAGGGSLAEILRRNSASGIGANEVTMMGDKGISSGSTAAFLRTQLGARGEEIIQEISKYSPIEQKEFIKQLSTAARPISVNPNIAQTPQSNINRPFEIAKRRVGNSLGIFANTEVSNLNTLRAQNQASLSNQNRNLGLNLLENQLTPDTFLRRTQRVQLLNQSNDFSANLVGINERAKIGLLGTVSGFKLPESAEGSSAGQKISASLSEFQKDIPKMGLESARIAFDNLVNEIAETPALYTELKDEIINTYQKLSDWSSSIESETETNKKNEQEIKNIINARRKELKTLQSIDNANALLVRELEVLTNSISFLSDPTYIKNQIGLGVAKRTSELGQTSINRGVLDRTRGTYFSDDYAQRSRAIRQDEILTNPNFSGLGGFGASLSETLSYTKNDLKRDLSDAGAELGMSLKSSFADAWKEFARGQKSAGDALREFALNFAYKIQDKIIDIGTQQIFGAALSGLGSAFKFKNCGGIVGYSSGGLVSGGSGIRDDIPAMLSTGDYVINKNAVGQIGVDTLKKLNSGVNISLANAYDFVGGTRPTGGSFNTSPFLSTFALTDENNPQNRIKFSREEELYSYLNQRSSYDAEKATALRDFKTQKRRQFTGSLISAAISIGGSAIGGIKGGKGGIGRTTIIQGATGNTLVSSPYDTRLNLGGGSVFGGSGIISRNMGGEIHSSGSDNVPVMLTGGEFVVNKDIVNKYGTSYFDQLNKGRIPGFANGGLVGSSIMPGEGDSVSKLISAIQSLQFSFDTKKTSTGITTTPSSSINVYNNITINKSGDVESSSSTEVNKGTKNQDSDQQDIERAQNLGKMMENVARKVIIDNLRNGGLLENAR